MTTTSDSTPSESGDDQLVHFDLTLGAVGSDDSATHHAVATTMASLLSEATQAEILVQADDFRIDEDPTLYRLSRGDDKPFTKRQLRDALVTAREEHGLS